MIFSSTLHAQASAKEQEYLAGWQRSRAELDNFRKHMQAGQAGQRAAAQREVVESLLALADNFQALAKHVPPQLKDNSWTQGVLHVARQFEQLLQEHGVSKIHPQGETFDPQFHEAVEEVKGEKSGLIIDVLQPGYVMGDVVLRPAKVRVSQ